MNSTFVTVASWKWTGLFSSNSAANAWCARSGGTETSAAKPVRIAAPAVICVFIDVSFSFRRSGRIPGDVALIHGIALRNLAGDIHVHRGSFPVFHKLVLAEMAIKSLLHHLDAAEIGQLGVRFEAAVDGKTDFPGPGEYLRVFQRGFVVNHVLTLQGVPLGDLQGVAMKIAGPVEPRAIREIRDIHDQRVALPMAHGIAHPQHVRI